MLAREVEAAFLVIEGRGGKPCDRRIAAEVLLVTIVAGSSGRTRMHTMLLVEESLYFRVTTKAFRSAYFSSPLMAGCAVRHPFEGFMSLGKRTRRDLGNGGSRGKERQRQAGSELFQNIHV